MSVVLPITEGLTMNNHLVLNPHESLAIIPLDGTVGGHDFS